MALLQRTEPGLPSAWYFDPGQYRRELERIWYRDWVGVGRHDELAATGDYFTTQIGDQRLIVTRAGDGSVHAFHDTCRHRGSALCDAPRGRFSHQRIVCPYHAWTYDLHGRLVATPVRIEAPDFDRARYSLYAVPVAEWGGFIFVNLSASPLPLTEQIGSDAKVLDQWPLGEMVSVRRETTQLACNWKIYWENYSECYHCPLLHPELCRIVPVYRHGVLESGDVPGSAAVAGDVRPRVAAGLRTWTLDGQSDLPDIPGPDTATRELGVAFASFTASMFVVGHPDYVRSVRMLPRGPELLELTIDWLLPKTTAETHADQLDRMFALGELVIAQDAVACERNQRGLRSPRHERGVLVPQEESVWQFHHWLHERLA